MNSHSIIATDDVRVRVMGLPGKGATDWHHHTEVTDFFVCLTGEMLVETEAPAGATRLMPGQTAEVRPLQLHRVVNLRKEPSEYLLVQGVGRYDFVTGPAGRKT